MRAHILRATGLDSTSGRILDVGCGTGALLQEIGAAAPAALYGLDNHLPYLHNAQENTAGASLTCGDAFHLPYAADSMQAAFCHFLFLWLSDPARALEEMCRVVQPGGWVIAFAEPDHSARIDHPAELEQLGSMQTRALQNQGANPAIGRALRGLFTQTGLQNVQAGIISGHWNAGFDPAGWEQEWQVLTADLADSLPEEERLCLKAIDRHAWQTGERILYIPTFYAWGQVL